MAYAEHDGVRVYYEKEPGPAPAILLVHGYSYSSQSFYASGYVEALRGRHALLIPDLPAHGKSDKPRTVDAYRRERVVAALLSVLDAEQVPRAVYFGYSLGAILGFSAAHLAARRFHAWVLGGEQPYGPIDDWPAASLLPLRQGMDAYIAFLESRGGALGPRLRERLRESDGEALACFAEAVQGYLSQPEALGGLTAPTLLYAGTADPSHPGLRRAASAVPGARLVTLDGLGHGQVFQRCDLVMQHVLPFLSQVAQNSAAPPGTADDL